MSNNDDPDGNEKPYDIILFGVTGFTGKLAAEYLLQRRQYQTASPPSSKRRDEKDLRWAACARNRTKAESALRDVVDRLNERSSEDGTCGGEEEEETTSAATATTYKVPPLLVADLECQTPEQVDALRSVVEQASVVLTCCGPFELYGTTLVGLCAELGVDYADITGETDFVRQTIAKHDAKARITGARIVPHCGNDCIPQDLMVYEMHRYARDKMKKDDGDDTATAQHYALAKVETCVEFAETAAWSGGTAATAAYQLFEKDRGSAEKPPFDPLLTNESGQKSDYKTKNLSPKVPVADHRDFHCAVEPWVMGPVMVNCVRRSKYV